MLPESTALKILHFMEPEEAHGWAIWALRNGMVPGSGPVTSPRLETEIAGLKLPNPLGLAAGFDKNAVALGGLAQSAFGFLEVGAATPEPQSGNARPRVFRLKEDKGIINRFGFNNDGALAISARLEQRPKGSIVGLNLGANKNSEDRVQDYVAVLVSCAAHVDFVTVNVSSPNTEGLRDLQGRKALWALLTEVLDARGLIPERIPVFLKIAPDLTDEELEDIADVAVTSSLDGLIATNTTRERKGLKSRHAKQEGGLSGAPLFDLSTQIQAKLYRLTQGKLPIIGVGGVSTAAQAIEKIRAGATAVQLYSSMIYSGISVAKEIAEGMDRYADEEGLKSISDIRGETARSWAGF
ncbi:MAG: quinone-dependent dihydroorotate dehydrogenase [Mangrovicoccus sp.]